MEADPEARAKSGVLLALGRDGVIDVTTLCVLPEADAKGAGKAAEVDPDAFEDGEGREDDEGSIEFGEEEGYAPPAKVKANGAESEKPRISFALRESLSAGMTEAIAAALKTTGHIEALSVAIAGLTVALESYSANPLRIRADRPPGVHPDFNGPDWLTAFKAAQGRNLMENLGELARLTALTLDLGQPQADDRNSRGWERERPLIIDAIASALLGEQVNPEIARVFDPEDYFKRVSIDLCKEAIAEMGNRPIPRDIKKKGDIVRLCAAFAKETGWLPPELRTVHYAGPAAPKKDEA
jgi:ParB family transcriptional regulator, chromosome partitioning protein